MPTFVLLQSGCLVGAIRRFAGSCPGPAFMVPIIAVGPRRAGRGSRKSLEEAPLPRARRRPEERGVELEIHGVAAEAQALAGDVEAAPQELGEEAGAAHPRPE